MTKIIAQCAPSKYDRLTTADSNVTEYSYELDATSQDDKTVFYYEKTQQKEIDKATSAFAFLSWIQVNICK